MATKNNPGAYDCYANAHPDEPMFVLLARDRHAPALVWLWSVLRELEQEDPAKVAEARKCMADMVEWAHARGRQAVGVGQSVLAGVLELIRVANFAVEKNIKNAPTDEDVMRMFLARTVFAKDDAGQK